MHKNINSLAITAAALLICVLLSSCASSGDANSTLKPRQTVECPESLMMICEGNNEPSKASDEEIPQYDRCYCRPRPN